MFIRTMVKLCRSLFYDEMIVWCLGWVQLEQNLTVQWPSMVEDSDFIDLTNFDVSHINNFANPVIVIETSPL